MTTKAEILGQGSTENKVENLADYIAQFGGGSGDNGYQLPQVAFMNFWSNKSALDEYGRVRYLAYTRESGHHMANDLYFFTMEDESGDENHYIGVGKAANVFTQELIRLKGDEDGLISNPFEVAAQELSRLRTLLWAEPFEDNGAMYQQALIGSNLNDAEPIMVFPDSGVALLILKRADGTLFYSNADEIEVSPYLGDDVVEASEYVAQFDIPEPEPLPRYRPESCLFPLTLDFKLEIWFPATTKAPTASEIEVSLLQPSGYDNEHFYPYNWNDTEKKLTVYGSLTDCMNYENRVLFDDSGYLTEFKKNGAIRISFKCGSLDFRTVEDFNMQGGIAIHGAQPIPMIIM